jgi:hypothetical protein
MHHRAAWLRQRPILSISYDTIFFWLRDLQHLLDNLRVDHEALG